MNFRKKIFFFFLISLLGFISINAQVNRMWIPSEADMAYAMMMESGGVTFKQNDLYDPDKPSFNDAIVQFNGGCTGEIISPNGLVLTNHHCGYSAIQAHSTLEHNYVEDGFWAKSYGEELPNPGMYVTFVRKILNVTDKVLDGVTDDMSEQERQSRIDANIGKLKKTIRRKPWQDVSVKSFFHGNKYYAFIEETYKDIRLVGAPPSAIGKFGADTDNWMWPRHSGDFSLFRIYADKNNRPAEYSPDNRPYRPEKYLKVSMEGVKKGDLIVVYGFPGRTQEYLPSFRVRQIVEKVNPLRISIREKALEIMDKYMRSNDTLKLKYTAQFARVANYWKKWKGENTGIRRSGAIANKVYMEKLFRIQLENKHYPASDQAVLDSLKNAYEKLLPPELARNVFIEAGYLNNPWMERSYMLLNVLNDIKGTKIPEGQKQRILASFDKGDVRVEKDLFIAMTGILQKDMPPRYLPGVLKQIDPAGFAENMMKNSVLTNRQRMEKLLDRNAEELQKALKNDSGISLAQALLSVYYGKINPDYQTAQKEVNRLMRKYVKLQMELNPAARLNPDANGTLRITYGRVLGYDPRDGVHYEPFSTIDGVIEKYIPGDYEFDLPEAYLNIYKKKDFGPYAVNGTVPVNFLGTAHTTGGNSGSPALNRHGELVGLNFDRVWEGTMSDLFYDPKICRNIMVDIRYVLFIIDKLGNAQNLIQEIKPQKSR